MATITTSRFNPNTGEFERVELNPVKIPVTAGLGIYTCAKCGAENRPGDADNSVQSVCEHFNSHETADEVILMGLDDKRKPTPIAGQLDTVDILRNDHLGRVTSGKESRRKGKVGIKPGGGSRIAGEGVNVLEFRRSPITTNVKHPLALSIMQEIMGESDAPA